jgi:CBS domain-containing protein
MESVQTFLKGVAPFSLLSDKELDELAKKLLIEFFPKDTLILRRDVDKAEFVYIVRKGAVRITRGIVDENERLVSVCGEKDIFGASSVLEGEAFVFNAKTSQDTICYLLPKDDFKALLQAHKTLADFFSSQLSVSLANAYLEGSLRLSQHKSSDDMSLLYNPIRSLIKRSPVICTPELSVREAAEVMTLERIGSIVVVNEHRYPIGILTDTDMRAKVIAKSISTDTPISKVMSAPVVTIDAEQSILDGLMLMTKRRIHHLCVVERHHATEQFIGVVSKHDLVLLHGISPVAAVKNLAAQQNVQGLLEVRAQMDAVIDALIVQGIRARKLTELITAFNDELTVKLIEFAERKMQECGEGNPPVAYTWMALGSEGRREQTIATDQDNAIVFENTPDSARAKAYFLKLGEFVVNDLEQCGFPKCKGFIMATNPEWCALLNEWKQHFHKWVHSAHPKALLHSAIFFDLRALYGKTELVEALYDRLFQEINQAPNFFFFMTQNALRTKPPIGFFGTFVVESSGENKHKFNLKERALRPLVDCARILSLAARSMESSTVKRFTVAKEHGLLREMLIENAIEAFDYLMTLRLAHHSRQRKMNKVPDNFIDPDDLSAIERNAVKEAFRVIEELQAEMRDKFGGGREVQIYE